MKWREIIERWAVGSHIDKATGLSRKDQTSDEYQLLTMNIRDVFSNLDDNQAINPTSRQGKARIAGAEEHWKSGGYMDPSIIYFSSATLKRPNGAIWFTDGRHRLYAAMMAGDKWAEVLVPVSDVDKIKSLIRVK